ncbi:P-loop containing nucleoside triphosphate hydrolase protein [Calycina marina]|uniref:P-loop containing nucleoside triphosphate hydrolase protein n=1 Tax=Calycina marina TaxID=1763456 RepID=A0A9P7Z7V4_9HELO|nr:P-loop containing nucleoside triphosphate hydrolase protein [Calycina marina]
MGAFETLNLSALRSEEQLSLLDEIDKFRRPGISDHVSLPQIAAISGIPFPRKDTLRTRFATELVLRKSSMESVVVNIVPSQQRSKKESQELASFQYTLQSFDKLPELIESAKIALGLDKPGSGLSSDILRIEISGPTRPHLTVVDLPGLIHAKNDDEDDGNVEEVVSEIVYSYMRRPRTIILAVVSALNDRALQAVLKRVKAVDPHGRRTMGLITKPDTLFQDSESEREFVKLALNDVTHLRLGWHVLRNHDFHMKDVTSMERDRIEEEFFSQGVWKTLPRGILGVAQLRERLSKNTLNESQQALTRLGDRRGSAENQRLYLLKHSQHFTTICRASCDGIYEDNFFGDLASEQSRARRFRAVVQNLKLAFAEKVRLEGQRFKLQGNGLEGKSDEAISWARDTLISSRGREFPGTFSPMLIGDLFKVQSKPWESLSKAHLEDVWTRARKHVEDILSTLMDAEACVALLMHYVDPLMEKLLKTATSEMDGLFNDRHRHAITYNHYFTENVQKIFNSRYEKRLLDVLKQMFPLDYTGNGRTGPKDLSAVCSMISLRTIPDMDTRASIEFLDHLESFYKVAPEDSPTPLIQTPESRPLSIAGSYVSHGNNDVQYIVASQARVDSLVDEVPDLKPAAVEVDEVGEEVQPYR